MGEREELFAWFEDNYDLFSGESSVMTVTEKVNNLFDKMDIDKNGVVSREEFDQVWRQIVSKQLEDDKLYYLALYEGETMPSPEAAILNSTIRHCWKIAGPDKDGFVSQDSAFQALQDAVLFDDFVHTTWFLTSKMDYDGFCRMVRNMASARPDDLQPTHRVKSYDQSSGEFTTSTYKSDPEKDTPKYKRPIKRQSVI